jgi:hypothetical protein
MTWGRCTGPPRATPGGDRRHESTLSDRVGRSERPGGGAARRACETAHHLVLVIAAVFAVVDVWQNKGLDRNKLPGPKIIEINPGSNIP